MIKSKIDDVKVTIRNFNEQQRLLTGKMNL